MGRSVLISQALFGLRRNERFYRALVFSLVLHAAVLVLWLPQHQAARETGAAVLTVVLSRPSASAAASSELPLYQQHIGKTLDILTRPDSSSFSVRTRSAAGNAVAQHNLTTEPVKKVNSGTLGGPTEAAEAGGETRHARRPGEARFVFEIRDDGQVGQIIWDQLPALTDEQFNRLETRIRLRYQLQSEKGQFVRQTIDVRDFLGADYSH